MEREEGHEGARAAGEPGSVAGDERDDRRLSGEAGARSGHPESDGFGEGYDQVPDTEAENQEPNFARGISHEDVPGTEHHGSFSEGHEELPDSPEKQVEGRFSKGQERSPTSE